MPFVTVGLGMIAAFAVWAFAHETLIRVVVELDHLIAGALA